MMHFLRFNVGDGGLLSYFMAGLCSWNVLSIPPIRKRRSLKSLPIIKTIPYSYDVHVKVAQYTLAAS